MILLSLASKQIWPQVLTTARLRPERLVLLHSDEAQESKQPAQRLKRFIEKQGLIPRGNIGLEGLSDSDFAEIEKRLDELSAENGWNPRECVVNITGGNKLMATAAFRWAARRGVRTFYLERRNRMTWFDFRDGEVATASEPLDGHIADGFDPVALLRCQVDASEVEREGERLTLAPLAVDLGEDECLVQLMNGTDPLRFLRSEGTADEEEKRGDGLELMTAVVLLKLGVASVQRGLRLKVKAQPGLSSRAPHAEIDLLFVWAGKLWLVDCKDRKGSDQLMEGLRRELGGTRLNERTRSLMDRIGKELAIGQTKALKEDLIAIREAGGLLGQVVCIRKATPSEEVAQYARQNRIEIVAKSELVPRWKALLFPDRKPNVAELTDLATAFGAR